MKLRQLLQQTILELAEVSDCPQLEAEILISFVRGTTRECVACEPEAETTAGQRDRLKVLVDKRLNHVPLQYLTNSKYFYGREFYVNEHVLIPRPDTEMLLELAIKKIRQDYLSGHMTHTYRILDLCTGSGCLAISLILENLGLFDNQPYRVTIDLADISPDALKVAEENIDRLLPQNRPFIGLIESDLFAKLTGKYNLIVSNPPYIPAADQETWQPELNHEPKIALISGQDGMDLYRRIFEQLDNYLAPKGMFIGEIYTTNSEEMLEIARSKGFESDLKPGLADEPRFIVCQKV